MNNKTLNIPKSDNFENAQSEIELIEKLIVPGQIILIGGRPGTGKTSLMCNLITRSVFGEQSKGALVFNFEGSLYKHMLAAYHELNLHKITNGNLDDSKYDTMRKTVSKIMNVPLHIEDIKGISIADIRTKATELYRLWEIDGIKLDIIAIDYVQLIANSGSYRLREDDEYNISLKIEAMAKELNVAVIAVSQLCRGKFNQARDPMINPLVEDLRFSPQIGQVADTIALLSSQKNHSDTGLEFPYNIKVNLLKSSSSNTKSVKFLPNK